MYILTNICVSNEDCSRRDSVYIRSLFLFSLSFVAENLNCMRFLTSYSHIIGLLILSSSVPRNSFLNCASCTDYRPVYLSPCFVTLFVCKLKLTFLYSLHDVSSYKPRIAKCSSQSVKYCY